MQAIIILKFVFFLQTIYLSQGGTLTAKSLLETIAPTYKQAKLPPGFPSLNSINTDKFDYKTSGDDIKVSAQLEKPVVMFPDYVIISGVQMNFTFNKKNSDKTAWKADVKGLWAIGSTIAPVNITSNGTLYAFVKRLELKEIVSQCLKKDANKDIGIDTGAITLKDVVIRADVLDNMNGVNIEFSGLLDHNSLEGIPVKITMNKYANSKPQLFSVIQFRNISPEKVLKKLLNQKTLTIPFMAHMLSGSRLFSDKQDIFGLAFSYTEVYYYREATITSDIIASVLQSHIPIGVTLLFPLNLSKSKMKSLSETVKIAFVINKPSFDLLIDKRDKLAVDEILPIISEEFQTNTANSIPNFMIDLNDAFTTHLTFDSTTTTFSIFVRLTETIDLVKSLLKIQVTHLVLQRRIGLDDKKQAWKVAAKGVYTIRNAKINVQYSELSNETGKPYGLTGIGSEVSLEDIVSEFDPSFYPDEDSKEMIENTEIESLKIHQVKLFSRVPRSHGTPHLLITGYTNLPEFEKDIQIALLLLYKNEKWQCKWAASLKHSPLSNIIQAFTGFDSRNLKLLHNGHILTTIISSPLPSYTLLPPHIITTPLLRLPVKKALTLIALLRFPDNCGDDKMCESASELLDTSKMYTVKGVISMDGFKLRAKIKYNLNLSNQIKGVNSTIQFTIGNSSMLDIVTSLKIARSSLMFDGFIHIRKSGEIQLQMACRKKRWIEPFKMKSLIFENLKLVTSYKTGSDLDRLKMQGRVLLGTPGNGDEIEAPLMLDYNPSAPLTSSFYGNYTDITLDILLSAFSITTELPGVLSESNFPTGLMLSYSGKDLSKPTYTLHGEINIFGRLLNCQVLLPDEEDVRIITDNSPAPVIFAKGLIIIQADWKRKLRGPTIVANIDNYNANVTVKGYVKTLGIESEADIVLEDKGVRFSISGKLMDYKQTKLTAYSLDSTDSFQVYGCFEDLAEQVQILLLEIIDKAANQSIINMEKADQNYLNAQKHYENAEREEVHIRSQRNRARVFYEEHLLAYGRFEVKVNDTCTAPKCGLKCFGCPKLQKCCRLDIFGHCISCSSWKTCCWKNINPLCIAKHDGCHVVKAVAERDLTEKEAQLIQQRIILDNLDQHVTNAEVNKGKHKAVLEAATDAKAIVEEDSSPGLNAHDSIRNFGTPYGWAKVNSICYNTSIEQAATGCMKFQISNELFGKPEQNITIWSCLKEDLVTEITESLANFIFPKIIDNSADSITEVAMQLNSAEVDKVKTPSLTPQIVNENDLPSLSNNELSSPSDNELSGPGNNEGPNEESPSPQDGELLHEALGDGPQNLDDQNTLNSPPPNMVDTNGKPQVMLIDSSRIGDYANKPRKEEKEREQEKEEEEEEEESESSASGEEATNEELKELYDNETHAKANNDEKMTNDKNEDNEKDTLAKEIVEQEEVDEEAEEGNAKKITKDKKKKRKKKKSKKRKNKLMNAFSQQPSSVYQGTQYYDHAYQQTNNQSSSGRYASVYPSRNQSSLTNVYQASSYNNAPTAEGKYTYAPNYTVENQTRGSGSGVPNMNSSQAAYYSQSLPYNNANLTLYKNRQANDASIQPSSATDEPFNRTDKPFFAGYTPSIVDSANFALQQSSEQLATNYVPAVTNYASDDLISSTNANNNVRSNVSKTRKRRNIEDVIRSQIPMTISETPKSRILFSNPFWDIKSDRSITSTRSNIPMKPHQQKLMRNVIHKRWKIPDNSNGRCHIFHQLIAICKDMAETIVMLEKSIKDSRSKFNDEDKDIYLELFETEDFLIDAAKRVNVSNGLMLQAGKTLSVVRQGVNIWSKRCSNEFDWQNESGVQSWLQAMDLRIQELGGYGVYRFLENLFHAFEALFEALTYSNSSTARDARAMLQRIRHISSSFDKIFRNKLSVFNSRIHADRILKELTNLRKDTTFC